MEHGKEEITLPEKFKCHTALFSDEEANEFPPTCGEGDHKIILMDTTPTLLRLQRALIVRLVLRGELVASI